MKYKRRARRLLLFVVLTVFVLSITVQLAEVHCDDNESEWWWCRFRACDDLGNNKNTFLLDEDVYVRGGCFGANNDVDIYVIPNGMATKTENAVSGPILATSDDDGHLPITLVWSNPLIGKYDVWVDVDQNGIFEWWIDGHYYCICDCHLFLVVPEYLIGSIGALIAMFGSFAFLRHKKMHNRKLSASVQST